MQDAHKRAFVVAKMTKADLLTDVRDSLQKALDEGKPFEEWKKEIDGWRDRLLPPAPPSAAEVQDKPEYEAGE